MPNVKIEFKNPQRLATKTKIVDFLCKLLAEELSYTGNQLSNDDFSVKFYNPDAGSKMADCEISIFAHSYMHRVNRQDEIAQAIKKAFVAEFSKFSNMNVSLFLVSYGYSFKM